MRRSYIIYKSHVFNEFFVNICNSIYKWRRWRPVLSCSRQLEFITGQALWRIALHRLFARVVQRLAKYTDAGPSCSIVRRPFHYATVITSGAWRRAFTTISTVSSTLQRSFNCVSIKYYCLDAASIDSWPIHTDRNYPAQDRF